MKIKVCDVCYWSEPKHLRQSGWKVTHKSPNGMSSVSIDVCSEHKDFFKGHTYAENLERVEQLMFRQENRKVREV